MSSVRKCENEVKHLDRRKTDLHGFLDPFTLLLDRSKIILAVSGNDLNLSRALRKCNINVIEARTMSDRNDQKKIAERNRDELRKTQVKKIEENGRDISKERKERKKHTNKEERYALYDITIHSTRRSAIAIIIFVFNKSTVLRRVYSTILLV